jgi:hypothetical protein
VAEPPQRASEPASAPAAAPRGERYGSAVLPHLSWLVLVLVAAGLLAVGADAISNDTWLGIAGGRELLQHGFETTNTWTRIGSHDWADQQWGAHVVFYGVWRLAGAAGLVALNVALLAAGFALCLRARPRRASAVWSAVLMLLVPVICVGELVFVRTQSFSVFCFGLLACLLGRDDGRLERRVLLALPLIAVWANLHAAVLVGAGVCVLYAASCLVGSRERTRALGLAIGACVACFASPVGLELPAYLRQTVENDDFRHFVSEWQPVTLSNSPLFVVAALLACAVAVRATIPKRDKLFVCGLTLAGFTAIRSELWAALAWLVVLPGALETLRPLAGGRRLRTVAGAFAVIAPACLCLAIAHDVRDGPKKLSTSWPPAAAQIVGSALARDPGLRVFADEVFADWLLVDAPGVRGRLAIDSRFETFHPQTFAALAAIRDDPPRIAPWIAAEDVYVLDPAPGADGPLARVLEQERGMVELYRSARVLVLGRDL